MRPLHLALIWHMHQPMYRDPVSHYYMMPWVRLHAVKDYLDMATILHDYPRLKQTFNLVPSLLEQLEDYASGQATDRYLILSQIPVAELSPEEKEEILQSFFDLNWDTMIQPFERYRELAERRSAGFQKYQNYYQTADHFSDQDFLDLTTWFNLSWIDPHLRELNPELRNLLNKGRHFSSQDRKTVLKHHQRIVQAVIPTYRELAAKGQIELTTTPYYHPILPLLTDSQNIQQSRPESPMPRLRLQVKEDAKWHLAQAKNYCKTHLGIDPAGLWPSEQAMSPDVLELVSEQGFQWMASSEGILWHSLKAWSRRDQTHVPELAEYLYRPWKLPDSDLTMVFRDIYLSDLIGFQCWRGDNEHNAHLFYQQIKRIQARLNELPEFPYLLTIALDGENCWEYYQNDGHHFLKALYTLLNQDQSIVSTTVSDYLKQYPAQDVLPRLHPGSWINSDFSTWSGDPTKNYAWDLVSAARQALVAKQDGLNAETRQKAWQMLYTAQGSDWFWWFGEGHSSAHDHLFDAAFRTYLQEVYHLINTDIPEALLHPLETQVRSDKHRHPHVVLSTMQQSKEGY